MILPITLLLATLPANTVALPGCVEPTAAVPGVCQITAVSIPNAPLYFVAGAISCVVPMVLTKLPLSINDASFNAALCPTDPAPGVTKNVVAQEQAASYTVSYSIGGKAQPVYTVPAISAPPPPTTTTKNCTVTVPSSVTVTINADGSFNANNVVINLNCQ